MATGKALEGKTAVVTGASRGIGLAIARKLGELGAGVGICAREPKRLENAARELKGKGIKTFAVHADVTRPADIMLLLQQTQSALGPIDILVNNAGTGYFGPSHEASEADWDTVLDTNLKAVFLLTKAIAPGMIARGGGHIINIASLAGKNAFAGGGIYCASKWGLLGFTQCVAEDLRGYGIRVSAVCPGSVATEFSPHTGKDPRKMLQPDDVAHAVAMLVTQAPQSFISEVVMRPTQKP
ncbi:MAG TPA: SDR family NAD(P)-dependent oxidoreductase [Candidatus Acidoferrum sp.]|nr:SDR family NAD(P)-dependent oxidoreductase [Candidatus Acidoferrum sp.]